MSASIKKIQKLIGSPADGIPGKNTYKALWDYCDPEKLALALPNLGHDPDTAPLPKKAEKVRQDDLPSDSVVDKITQVLSIYEMGVPQFLFGDSYWYHDGKNDQVQCTLSIGFTEAGSLQKVLDRYIANKGKYAAEVKKYRPQIGKYTIKNQKTAFKALLKQCGKDPVMQEAQVFVFRSAYLSRSEKFCQSNGLVLPLSRLVMGDSTLHSGSPAAPRFLRNRFAESPPASGGDEKKWTRAYAQARYDWLAGHSKKILRNTAKRSRFYLDQMDKNNWDLSKTMTLEGFSI